MPIKPENKARYPKDWKQIRGRILERAENRCEECTVPNYAYRANDCGEWSMDPDAALGMSRDGRVTRIVLTVAHLDHTPENCADENLKALCQRCHLRYDHEHHMRNAAATRRRGKAIAELPLG